MDFEAFDDDPAGGGFDVSGELFVCSGNPPGTPCQSLGSNNTAGNPGWTSFALSFPPLPVTIDNLNNQYVLAIFLPDDGGLTAFRRAIVYYHLQVSPAPMVATFNDVPVSDGAFQFIEAFSQAGITVGCGGGNYCPDDFVTRRQMAVFFAKAFGLFWAN